MLPIYRRWREAHDEWMRLANAGASDDDSEMEVLWQIENEAF